MKLALPCRSAGSRNRADALHLVRWLLAAVSLVAGLFVAVRSLRMVALSWQKMPYGDQWDELVTGRDITWSWLVAQHNEHRIFFPRLIFIADSIFAHETNLINHAANIAIQLAMMGLVFHLAREAGLRDLAGRVWAAGMCLALLLWAGQFQNLLWGFQVQFFGVVLAAAAAFGVLARGALGPFHIGADHRDRDSRSLYLVQWHFGAIPGHWPRFPAGPGPPNGEISLTVAAVLSCRGSYLWGYSTPQVHQICWTRIIIYWVS